MREIAVVAAVVADPSVSISWELEATQLGLAVRALGHVATALFLAVIAGFFAEARTSLAQTPSNPPGDLLEFRSSAAIAAE